MSNREALLTASPVTESQLYELMTWFASREQLDQWAGPNFRFPLVFASFVDDLRLSELDSISLIDAHNRFSAFGQVYCRVGRCHLGRLIVAPDFRGQGIISQLINTLTTIGHQKFNTTESSLFVLNDNTPAIKAYEKLGFRCAPYPQDMPLENTQYMIK
jgi:ribosomal protein S18 acetylase RimI-like enzyme